MCGIGPEVDGKKSAAGHVPFLHYTSHSTLYTLRFLLPLHHVHVPYISLSPSQGYISIAYNAWVLRLEIKFHLVPPRSGKHYFPRTPDSASSFHFISPHTYTQWHHLAPFTPISPAPGS
jgi:hypothetical protein